MIYIIIATVMYAAAILFGALASRNINSTLAAGLTNILSAVIPLVVAAPYLTKQNFQDHKFGAVMAIVGGICIAIFAMALNKSFTLTKVGVAVPLVFGGAIVLSAILSAIFLKEKLTALEAAGLGLVALGFALIIYARATSHTGA